jgi:hypothetical protein
LMYLLFFSAIALFCLGVFLAVWKYVLSTP